MVLVISRFKVANGMEQGVRAAFLARPRLVDDAPGFLGMEVFTDTEDSAAFHLVTRWTDLGSYRSWHGSEAHHMSHRGIPKGLKLAPGFTQVIELERLSDPYRITDIETMTADSKTAIASFLAESRTVHLLVAAPDGTILVCNTALANRLKIASTDIVGRSVWDLVTEQENQFLHRRLVENSIRAPVRFLINFVDVDRCPFTLECRMEIRPGYFVVLGECPQRTNDVAQDELIRLNNDLAVLSREHARRAKELDRTLDALRNTQWHLAKIQDVLPICLECGKVKTTSQWEDVVSYLKEHAQFLSHGYCPECLEKLVTQLKPPPQE